MTRGSGAAGHLYAAVRIEVPTNVAEQEVLRPGMSVVVSVDTKKAPAATAVATEAANAPSTQRP